MSASAGPISSLLSIVSGQANSIDEVVQRMDSIDQALSSDDGLKWFNLLYLYVTREVRNQPSSGGFLDPAWLTRLDVVFANYYFSAIRNLIIGQTVPSSWQALFEARRRPCVDRIQFALAGMNAHINHDLALALVDMDSELRKGFDRTGAQHQDYEYVNGLLENVLPEALKFLATGILGEIAQDTGKIGRLLAIWNVRVARSLAWDYAEHLESLPAIARPFSLNGQDKLTGAVGRALLMPLDVTA